MRSLQEGDIVVQQPTAALSSAYPHEDGDWWDTWDDGDDAGQEIGVTGIGDDYYD